MSGLGSSTDLSDDATRAWVNEVAVRPVSAASMQQPVIDKVRGSHQLAQARQEFEENPELARYVGPRVRQSARCCAQTLDEVRRAMHCEPSEPKVSKP